jgi:hypothetical protein
VALMEAEEESERIVEQFLESEFVEFWWEQILQSEFIEFWWEHNYIS